MTPSDGAFGEPAEGWALTTEPLTQGHHVLDLEGTTGETAGRTRNLWAGPTPVTVELATNAAFTKKAVTVAAGAAARVYARSTSAGLPVARLAPLQIVRLADDKVMATLGDRRKRRVDRHPDAGAHAHLRGALCRRRPVPGPRATSRTRWTITVK